MGKTSVVYVVGLGVIVGIILLNVNRSAVDSMDSYTTYFGRTMAHDIALAGANIGTNKILFDASFNTAFSDSFGGGKFWASYDSTSPMSKTLTVRSAFPAYSSYAAAGSDEISDTIRATFKYVMFSRYGWFTEKEANGYLDTNGIPGPYYGMSDWKVTGDSVFGPAHTNSEFHLDGSPFFNDPVTASLAPVAGNTTGPYNPIFNRGSDWSRTVPRDTANLIYLRSLLNYGSALPSSYFTNKDVGYDFKSDGTVRVVVPWNPGGVPWNTSGASLDTTMALADLSDSKVIGVEGGDVHVKGTYKGQVTVTAFSGNSGMSVNKGNIWVDGNLLASDDPRANQNSTDILGLVAERMGYITRDDSRTPTSALQIEAAIYCHRGELTAEDFWDLNKQGRVILYGGVCQKTAGSLGVMGSSGIEHGMSYSIRHDRRFLEVGPPAFPFSTHYRLVAWWEN